MVPLLLRRKQVAIILGLDKRYLDKLVRDGALPVIRLRKNGKALFKRDDIEKVFGIKL